MISALLEGIKLLPTVSIESANNRSGNDAKTYTKFACTLTRIFNQFWKPKRGGHEGQRRANEDKIGLGPPRPIRDRRRPLKTLPDPPKINFAQTSRHIDLQDVQTKWKFVTPMLDLHNLLFVQARPGNPSLLVPVFSMDSESPKLAEWWFRTIQTSNSQENREQPTLNRVLLC